MDHLDVLRRLAHSIRLRRSERAAMQAAVHTFMVSHPFQANPTAAAKSAGVHSYFFPLRTMPIVAIIAALVLSAGGGAALAAEAALPGDFLYPLKVHVNEEVMAKFNLSAEAKAAFETDLAERRLTEAQRLTAMGRINTAIRDELFTSFREHLVESTTVAETVTDVNASAQLKANIHTMLTAHAAALQEVSASVNNGALSAQIDEILREVHANAFVYSGTGIQLPGMPAQAAQIMINVAEKQIEKTEDRLDDADVSADVETAARAHLALAVTGLAEAKTALGAGNNADAFAKAKAAHRQAIEAKIALYTGSIFDRDDDDDEDDDDSSSSHSSTGSTQSSTAQSSVRSISSSSVMSSSVMSSQTSLASSSHSSDGDESDDDDDNNRNNGNGNNRDDDDDNDRLGDEIRKKVDDQIKDMKKRMKDRFDFDD